MATQTRVILIDDLTGEEADESVAFGLDGVAYSIDLTSEHAEELRESLNRWINSARRTGGRRKSGTRRTSSGVSAQEIRDWCEEKGIEVNQRGRIPVEIREQFREATGK